MAAALAATDAHLDTADEAARLRSRFPCVTRAVHCWLLFERFSALPVPAPLPPSSSISPHPSWDLATASEWEARWFAAALTAGLGCRTCCGAGSSSSSASGSRRVCRGARAHACSLQLQGQSG
eukprot:Hpha_TRINITY_DN34801_c0_g1::TRINITY_DN34801_c0_g1_i1::g.167794::m.167794